MYNKQSNHKYRTHYPSYNSTFIPILGSSKKLRKQYSASKKYLRNNNLKLLQYHADENETIHFYSNEKVNIYLNRLYSLTYMIECFDQLPTWILSKSNLKVISNHLIYYEYDMLNKILKSSGPIWIILDYCHL